VAGTCATPAMPIVIHGLGQGANKKAIGMIVVGAKAGTPIYLFQIADVLEGHDIRRGAVHLERAR